MLMSDVGGTAAAAADLTFADAAAGGIPAAGPRVGHVPAERRRRRRPGRVPGACPAAVRSDDVVDLRRGQPRRHLAAVRPRRRRRRRGLGRRLVPRRVDRGDDHHRADLEPEPLGCRPAGDLDGHGDQRRDPGHRGHRDHSDGATVLASGLTPDATGQVGATTSALAAGSHAITAGYAGTPASSRAPARASPTPSWTRQPMRVALTPSPRVTRSPSTVHGVSAVHGRGRVLGRRRRRQLRRRHHPEPDPHLGPAGGARGRGRHGRAGHGDAADQQRPGRVDRHGHPHRGQRGPHGRAGQRRPGRRGVHGHGDVRVGVRPVPDDLATLSYRYDFDNDGAVDLTGTSPSATVPASYLDVGPSTRTVRAVVADDDGGTTELTAIVVTAAAPRATIDGPSSAVVGQPLTIKVGAVDPSSADMAGVFQFAVDWGDGTPVESLSGPADPPVSHTYTTAGTFVVTATATDADGATSAPLTFTVVVSATPPPVDTPAPTEPAGREASTGTLADTGSAGVPGALRLRRAARDRRPGPRARHRAAQAPLDVTSRRLPADAPPRRETRTLTWNRSSARSSCSRSASPHGGMGDLRRAGAVDPVEHRTVLADRDDLRRQRHHDVRGAGPTRPGTDPSGPGGWAIASAPSARPAGRRR